MEQLFTLCVCQGMFETSWTYCRCRISHFSLNLKSNPELFCLSSVAELLFVTAILSTFLDWNHLDFFIIIITKVNISLFTSWWHSEIRQENLKINIGISITLYNRRKVAKIEDIWSFLLFKLLSISWRDGKDTRALLFNHARSPVDSARVGHK